ncbi:methyltransferase domain-containing protein [Bradyrhizobium sp. U87765 SZCCT0131]|uniref:class I SAM-dependent methyltransferase n=1 Tax=unclassified Bradyrhizobium TaxID=2631580 RepID=UPI001BAE0B4E|nr:MULTISPECIES: class I SAM-dependent methyltransferase [unclassified Bradyrhizobium]MBR1218973.1 methyltransferase domain-containing protein [Bradyrhizobium sp. U87765 SZCCT0131]MBR1261624.1 methyltransferase domain-containing protein [Bradyrhizobium sp. U87765 SZCCT0134]MBR1306523.1 methyltransferase domain-containing protein [Bradyrhizobium sp. U87765 SZCCT0110]MBR1317406.1 methyltransferase domain-containing protein [Bradyrhizobium sp. U87765 SZCCT0109]MBR1351108.1 methyltransferase domai
MTSSSPTPAPIDQLAFWNGEAGRQWTDFQDTLDTTFAPVLQHMLERATVRPGERVIDVGCGCGAYSVVLAKAVGASGEVLGIDISSEMLARARARIPTGAPLSYLEADAASHRFAAGHFDVLVSRFGVMFFADPVAAFTNLATALRPGGRVAFACWRQPRDNPYFMLPLQQAYKHVPKLPEMKPDDPGPFAFAARERVEHILNAAGFGAIALEPFDTPLDLAGGQGLDHAVAVALSIGPAGRALEGQPPEKAAATAQSIREALGPFHHGDRVDLPAAIWIVTAVKPA